MCADACYCGPAASLGIKVEGLRTSMSGGREGDLVVENEPEDARSLAAPFGSLAGENDGQEREK